MKKNRLLWQIFLSFIIITVITLTAITVFSTEQARSFFLKETSDRLKAQAQLVASHVKALVLDEKYDELKSIVKTWDLNSDTRFTIILPLGKVAADSRENPVLMTNHINRPEIQQAQKKQIGKAIRFSETIGKNLMYVAIPVYSNGKIVAILRTSIPITAVENAVDIVRKRIIYAGVFLAFFAGLISWVLSKRISSPLEEITRAVERFAEGDLDFRLVNTSSPELSRLALALNQMAGQLAEKIKTIDSQKNEQQAVFQSMAEGVLAVDHNQKILSINRAAANLLGISLDKALGRNAQDQINNNQIRAILKNALKSEQFVEEEIVFHSDEIHYVQVHGTNLQNYDGKTIGLLIVLNDVTRLRRLEEVRRDFVANVSHEIRTPLTSIKGFVETLLDGAIKEPETAGRFLDIILNQSNRLNSIIDDLLALASLEQNNERTSAHFDNRLIREVIEGAIEVCQPEANGKKIDLLINCEDDVSFQMDAPLIEQALINLIMNAVKYSPESTRIEITYSMTEEDHVIIVKDQGIGIAREHLDRIFERFYRVDKARSRKLGGTGLGLAIVKHIALVHGGRVTVESKVNSGSSFKLLIPLAINGSPLLNERNSIS